MPTLQDKVLVITGASGGIGAATAALAVAEGARVVLCDLDEDALNAVAAPLGDAACVAVTDVTSFEQQQAAVALAVERFGRLDAMVANAGIEGTVAPLVQQEASNIERVLAVNVMGVVYGIQAAAPVLSDGGSIVITSSVAGFIGSPGLAPYVTSKHAVVGLMRAAALELAPRVRVNTVHPGPIDNRMMRSIETQAAPDAAEAAKASFEAQVPLGRYGRNEEIAALITWLCSDASSFCTGQRFVADGGFLAQ